VGRYAILPVVLDALDMLSASLQSDQACWTAFRSKAQAILEPHVTDIITSMTQGNGDGELPVDLVGRRRLGEEAANVTGLLANASANGTLSAVATAIVGHFNATKAGAIAADGADGAAEATVSIGSSSSSADAGGLAGADINSTDASSSVKSSKVVTMEGSLSAAGSNSTSSDSASSSDTSSSDSASTNSTRVAVKTMALSLEESNSTSSNTTSAPAAAPTANATSAANVSSTANVTRIKSTIAAALDSYNSTVVTNTTKHVARSPPPAHHSIWITTSPQDTMADKLMAGKILHRAAQLNNSAAGAFLCRLYHKSLTDYDGTVVARDLLDAAYIAAVVQPDGCDLVQTRTQVWRMMQTCWLTSAAAAEATRCKFAMAHVQRPPALLNQTLSWVLGLDNADAQGRQLTSEDRLAMVHILARNAQYLRARNPTSDPNYALSFMYGYWPDVVSALGSSEAGDLLEDVAAAVINTPEQWLGLKAFLEGSAAGRAGKPAIECSFWRQRILSRAGCNVRCTLRTALPMCKLL
jgi:hypothetical protein